MASAHGPSAPPGAVVVLLRRRATSTDVLLLASASAPFPCGAARDDGSQWALAERLLDEARLQDVSRLYASALTVESAGVAFGVFVGFLAHDAPGDAVPDGARWVDLREACGALGAPWAGSLADVRERFVARPPDEALRVR